MIVIQTMPWRVLCNNLASRRTSHAARGGGGTSGLRRLCVRRGQNDAANENTNGNRCYANNPAPTLFPFNSHRRSFSKFSTDEIVIQDGDAPPPPTSSSSPSKCPTTGAPITATTTSSSSSSSVERINFSTAIPDVLQPPQKFHIVNNDQLISDLQRAHEFFHHVFNESKALLQNSTTATTSEEVVDMTNDFMILLNSLELEKHLEIVQSLQNSSAANEQQNYNSTGGGGNTALLEESLRMAIKSMSQLHHVFLKMVELSLPPLNSTLLELGTEEQSRADPPPPPQLHSAKTVRRALQLSRRAEELGLPLHRPLYQRLAVGVALTWSPRYSILVSDNEGTDDLRTPKVVEVHNPPALTLQLMEILANARSSFRINTEEQLVQLAEDILAEPVLLMLKSKQLKEVMDLMCAWQGIFGQASNGLDVLSLLGEGHTMKALEIVQGYTADTTFMEAVQTDPHVMELITLFEVALEEILKNRKKRVEKISEILWQLSFRNGTEDDDFDDGNNHDSDSEFGDEFEYESDSSDEDDEAEGEFDTFTASSARRLTPSDSPIVSLETSSDAGDKVQAVASYRANASVNLDEADDEVTENFTILSGLSNREARQSIYLRNGKDWVLPDIVSQLEDWNKGNCLSFTPMFEQYIGNQIAQEADDEDDDDDDDDSY